MIKLENAFKKDGKKINKQENNPAGWSQKQENERDRRKNIQRDSERLSDREAAVRWLMQNGTVLTLVKWLLCAEWR